MADMHSFNVDVAKEVGVNAAILLQSIKWWCEKNKANGKHCHDGLYWTYNSVKAWQELYPYLGRSAIESALAKLEDRGYVKTGNYNKSAYDRTKWYAITEKGLSIFGESIYGNQEMDCRDSGNGSTDNEEPIPDTLQLLQTSVQDTNHIPYSEIVSYLNEKAGTRYRPTTPKTQSLIRSRWHEGFTLDDFRKVIDVKCSEWLSTDMAKYLRPETLFGTKMEAYLNQPTERKGTDGAVPDFLADYDL